MKIVRLTEKQIREVYGDDFNYISDDTTPQYGGNTYITSTGKMDDEEFGDPLYTDELDVMAPQGYWYGWHYRNTPIHEAYGQDGQENTPNQDTDNDGIKNYWDNVTNNTLDDGDDKTNLTVIPPSILQKTDTLIQAISNTNLNVRQQYMIAARIMDALNLEKLDPAWIKNFSLHLKSKK